MTLYTKKKGKYVPLEKEHLRKMRRQKEVIQLQQEAYRAAGMLVATAAWIKSLNLRLNKMDGGDFLIVSSPVADRMRQKAHDIKSAIEALRKV